MRGLPETASVGLVVAVGLLGACGGHAAPGTSFGLVRRPAAEPRGLGRLVVLGRSVRGRAIVARVIGSPTARRRVLIVGIVHGDESGGGAVVRRLEGSAGAPGAALWLVRDLNPDGRAMGTRQNARGVDLNRNFPWLWRPLGHRGDPQYSGPRPLSEPESRIAHTLVLRLRPRVTIWFHQPLGVVDDSEGDPAIVRRFARRAGLPLARLPRYPGSAVGWQDRRIPHSTAFVVELPPGRLTGRSAGRLERAVLATAAGR